MGAIIDVKNPLEVRRAGLQALTETLGPDGMRAFMRQSIFRTGDFTAEKYDQPEESMEEIAAELRRITDEHRNG
jgi:hypothetical protein